MTCPTPASVGFGERSEPTSKKMVRNKKTVLPPGHPRKYTSKGTMQVSQAKLIERNQKLIAAGRQAEKAAAAKVAACESAYDATSFTPRRAKACSQQDAMSSQRQTAPSSCTRQCRMCLAIRAHTAIPTSRASWNRAAGSVPRVAGFFAFQSLILVQILWASEEVRWALPPGGLS